MGLKETATAMPCTASLDTVVAVKRCPRNKLEWDARAALVNCSSKNQTCVKPDEFKYHCVVNENYTSLTEVCAPTKPIHGIQFKHNKQITFTQTFET